MKAKSQKELRRGLTNFLAPYAGKHPATVLLDAYERQAHHLLESGTAPEKAERVLWCIDRVREKIRENDAEGAALYMYRLAVAVYRAKLVLIAPKGGSHSKAKEGIELVIKEKLTENPASKAWDIWWSFEKHHIGKPLRCGVYEIYLDEETQLLMQTDLRTDEEKGIARGTFDNYVTRIRKSLR